MRLKKIQVSGFKSFVDPTAITIPADITGIIGPNGCGKSNVIDAIRWVMGESSARKLRGDSMSDVIFNGSESRKPVGKASVELIFDNNGNAKSVNAFSRFNEISVKRTLSRDGVSEYLLNKIKCRRRDITDLFRGTGLGHRSYSIIEQGMVSRIVEAQPEELRNFVEEAAGISHYKDRRRETETRIRNTKDNLSRVEDIRKELDSQLRRLQRQSQVARRYQKLKEEERYVNGQLFGLRHLDQQKQIKTQKLNTEKAQLALDSVLARQSTLESQIDSLRTKEVGCQNKMNDLQAMFYSVSAEVASTEQTIEHSRDTFEQQRIEFQSIEKAIASNSKEVANVNERRAEIERDIEKYKKNLSDDQDVLAKALKNQNQCEQDWEEWEKTWSVFSREANAPTRDQEIKRNIKEQLVLNDKKLQDRLARLDEELQEIISQEKKSNLNKNQKLLETSQHDLKKIILESQNINKTITECQLQKEEENKLLISYSEKMHLVKSRLESYKEIQRLALNHDEEYTNWKKENDLINNSSLHELVEVTEGWERAVDAVLGARLTGVSVENMSSVFSDDADLPHQDVFIIERGGVNDNLQRKGTLHEYVKSDSCNLVPFLTKIIPIDDLNVALQKRVELTDEKCFVTKDGILIGKNWVQFFNRQRVYAGILERAEEINMMERQCASLTNDVENQKEKIFGTQNNLSQLMQLQEKNQNEQNSTRLKISSQIHVIADQQARSNQNESRKRQIEVEVNEIILELDSIGISLNKLKKDITIAENEANLWMSRSEELLKTKEIVLNSLKESKHSVQTARDKCHHDELNYQRSTSALESLGYSVARVKSQNNDMEKRYHDLKNKLDSQDEPDMLLDQKLKETLQRRAKAESELKASREELAVIENEIRNNRSLLSEHEQSIASARKVLEDEKLKDQELKVRIDTLTERITQEEYDLAAIQNDLPLDANHEEWTKKSDKIGRAIAQIGLVNLVAIEEYDEQAQRKEYLDSQHSDLSEALETLAGVIRKIDRETRERFKATFDLLNKGFAEFFPQMFGGGSAILQLTEEDLLLAGVTVMARPPGKRNSTIHLLSGGEKALTAVALLFALFKLNPAPFCILDEVDAPLDDRNVERYCQTLRNLSKVSQLVVITHNKITMESSDILLGVTMGEPGVSSIVSVDIDEAVRLAAH